MSDGQTPETCLVGLGIVAAQPLEVPIWLRVQKDSAFVWKAAAIHPLQTLENTYQRMVRRDPDAEFDRLSEFFLFDDSEPTCFLSLPPGDSPGEEPLAAVKMNYSIVPFYLFRLLVQYAIEADSEVSDEQRAQASSTLTSLLHDKTYMPWLSDWLIEKVGELGDDIEKLNRDEGGNKVLFFLKGGRALNYFLGTPEDGENDWDTQILINPSLPSEEWYKLFAQVHDRMLRRLTQFKTEFTDVVREHRDEFWEYVGHLVQLMKTSRQEGKNDEYEEDEEDDEYEEESSRGERDEVTVRSSNPGAKDRSYLHLANCKAELIDIGIPRRDTPEALEEWAHLNADLLKTDKITYPGHRYYLNEYLKMTREAFLENPDVRKTPKRVQRLCQVLALKTVDQAIEKDRDKVRRTLPKIAKAAEGRSPESRRLFTFMMAQFVDAYDLQEDVNLAAHFDADFAAKLSNTDSVKFDAKLESAIKKAKGWTSTHESILKDVGFGGMISVPMRDHYEHRATFMKEQRKTCRAFIGKVYEGFSQEVYKGLSENEDFSVELAISGSYAAYLHGKYLQFDRMGDLEPIRRIDLKLFTLGAGKGVLKYVQPTIETLLKPDTSPFPFELRSPGGPDGTSLLLYSREDPKQISFKPLVVKVSVEEVTSLPQLAFIKGLPVLDLRHLAIEYRRRTADIDELGVQTVLQKATTAVSEILSKFEF